MEIRAPRLLLRTWRRGDEDALVRNINHRSVWRNVGDSIPFPYTREAADAFLAMVEKDARSWHLAIVAGGDPIGSIGLYRFDGRLRYTGTIGYMLGPQAWGRGYASEALAAMSDAAFAQTDVARLDAHVYAWNPASCRVLEKCGFVREGVLRKSAFKDGELVDELVYARLRQS
jgi:RimJ/RimL family protein N-acetyltransferase